MVTNKFFLGKGLILSKPLQPNFLKNRCFSVLLQSKFQIIKTKQKNHGQNIIQFK